jgi:peroxiredoxin Q/BCP
MQQPSWQRPSVVRRPLLCGLVAALLAVPSSAASAQQSATPAPVVAAAAGPAVGEPAPDFTLRGATRFGILRDSIRLSDFRGQTVVLAFFYKARTKG